LFKQRVLEIRGYFNQGRQYESPLLEPGMRYRQVFFTNDLVGIKKNVDIQRPRRPPDRPGTTKIILYPQADLQELVRIK